MGQQHHQNVYKRYQSCFRKVGNDVVSLPDDCADWHDHEGAVDMRFVRELDTGGKGCAKRRRPISTGTVTMKKMLIAVLATDTSPTFRR